MRTRNCGDCNACCSIPSIPELDKPEFTNCSHLKRGYKGCTIYMDRPVSCKRFACLWLLGMGKNKDRPDRSGLMAMPPTGTKELPIIQVYKVGSSAKSDQWTEDAQKLIRLLSSTGHAVCECSPDGRRSFIGASQEMSHKILSIIQKVQPKGGEQ